jgi:hypothetical protein
MTTIIGEIDGNPVEYAHATDRVTCKSVTVSAKRMVEAYDSPLDRVVIKKDLALENLGFIGFTLGCFKVSPEKSKLLIESLKKARNAEKRRGESQPKRVEA